MVRTFAMKVAFKKIYSTLCKVVYNFISYYPIIKTLHGYDIAAVFQSFSYFKLFEFQNEYLPIVSQW